MSEWVFFQAVIQLRHSVQLCVPVALKGTYGHLHAVVDIRHEGFFKATVLIQYEIKLACCRVDRTIQNQAPHVLGEGVYVEGTNQGSIGVAEIVELSIAEEMAQQIKITNGRHRVDVLQELTGVGEAFRAKPDGLSEELLVPLGSIGLCLELAKKEVIQVGITRGAGDSCGLIHAPGVPTHNVEGLTKC